MALSTEQLLLLNNLMYLTPSGSNQISPMSDFDTIGDWMTSITPDQIKYDPGAMTTNTEINSMLNAIRNDPVLMNMKIAATHVDNAPGGGGGKSAVFISESTGEAVTAFAGTASGEWKDDFVGGNVEATTQQNNALEWYRNTCCQLGLDKYEMTVTGHSKGGNKAKFITVLDDSVDHCVSFDGQGFSDKFINAHSDRIAQNQSKISNHNVDKDYVNLLLNDIGKTTYYKPGDLQQGFLENHSAESLFHFDSDGNPEMVPNPDGQDPALKAFDQFLNSALRSMPDQQRTETLDLFGTIAQKMLGSGDNGDMGDFIKNLMLDPKYSDDLAYFAAYLLRYEKEHPEMGQHIRDVMHQFGMDDAIKYVDLVDNLLNLEFDMGPLGTLTINGIMVMFGGIAGSAANIPDWVLDLIRKALKKRGFDIPFSNEELRRLLKMAQMLGEDYNKIKISDDTEDIKIPSSGGSRSDLFDRIKNLPLPDQSSIFGAWIFTIYPTSLTPAVQSLSSLSGKLSSSASRMDSVINSIGVSEEIQQAVNKTLSALQMQLRDIGKSMNSLSNSLDQIIELYKNAERSITSK